jgi:hypothetical protein
VSVTALGDQCVLHQRYAEGAEVYHRVAAAHPGTALAAEAAYKEGLCHLRLGDAGAAFACWDRIAGGRWSTDIALDRIEHAFSLGHEDQALDDLARLVAGCAAGDLHRIAPHWARFAAILSERAGRDGRTDLLAGYVALHDRHLLGEPLADEAAAEALLTLERYQEVVDRYPRAGIAGLRALLYLGRGEEALARFADRPDLRQMALLEIGCPERLLAEYGQQAMEPFRTEALLTLGRYAEVGDLAAYPATELALGNYDAVLAGGDRRYRTLARIVSGRMEDLEPGEEARVEVLMARGRYHEAMEAYRGDRWAMMWPRHMLGLEAYIRGDREQAWTWFEVPATAEFHQQCFHLAHYLIVPLLRQLAGTPGELQRTCEGFRHARRYVYRQKPWYNAMRVLGEIDDAAFLAQTANHYAPADLVLCQAIAADADGRIAEAARGYAAYAALPVRLKAESPDPVVDRFVAWRVESLRP